MRIVPRVAGPFPPIRDPQPHGPAIDSFSHPLLPYPPMKTPISPDNPFGHNRAGFAWESVPRGAEAHLDFGCYEGEFLASLASRGVRRRVGVDASREAIERAMSMHPGLEVQHLPAGAPLPFAEGLFDSLSLMDVLEHVADQSALLAELRRVLKPGGVLIVTVPGQHVLSWLDLGNFKFRFPRLHRWFYCLRHTREEYERRYVASADGLVGDISAEKMWHEHFTREHLARLLGQAGLRVEAFDGSQLFGRWLILATAVVGRIDPLMRLIRAIERWDSRTFASMNLFCVARKV